METVYYCLTARKVKASGGAEVVHLELMRQSGPEETGKILDFQQSRRKLEEKAAPPAAQEEESERVPARRSGWATVWEVIASVAVLAASLAVGWAFLWL